MLVDPSNYEFKTRQGFIVIEGPNGAGKSTLISALKAELESTGIKARSTFEPGDSPHGKDLRRLLLGSKPPLEPTSELLLFAADRHEHIEKTIKPALAAGEIVLCDRYIYSTLAFQGFGRGLSLATIEALNAVATGGLVPDLVLLLDCPVELGIARTHSRAPQGEDSFEAEELAFHERLRQGFLTLAQSRPEPFVVIDATKGPDQVRKEAVDVVRRLTRTAQMA